MALFLGVYRMAIEMPLSLGLALTYGALAMTPGANFVLVTQVSLSATRLHALVAALGIAVGAAALALIALSGGAVIRQWSTLFWLVDVAFGLLLVRLAVTMLSRAWIVRLDPGEAVHPSPIKCFRTGVMTAMLNPITLAFLLGQATVLPSQAGEAGAAQIAPLEGMATVFAIAACWFCLLALGFSNAGVRAVYRRVQPVIDGATGLLFLYLASALLLDAVLHGTRLAT